MASNSFVENVNAIANATALATGDIVQDTQAARDEAVSAAAEANISKINAKDSEELSQSWANKGHNNPVVGTPLIDAEYSSYHWSVEASNTIGDPLINDIVISAVKTWSSQKISTDLSNKSDISHLHAGTYEPAFIKKSAFNKSFGGTGISIDVSRDDHLHSNYEPIRSTQGTAYNKDFGTVAGSVMQGDTNFDNDYMPLVQFGSAYNKNFVADSNNPQAEEVPRGNHGHLASGISYDNTGNDIISSSNVQGAIGQLDSQLGQITIAESTYITMLGSLQYTQAIVATNTPAKLIMPLPTIQSNLNATNNSNAEITISYPPLERPTKQIEGLYTISLQISSVDNYELNIAVNGVIAGESTSLIGAGEISVSQFVTNIDVTGINGGPTEALLSVWITNTSNANDVVIESANIVWNGQPQGALVFSGLTVDHADLSGTGAANGIHTISDIQGLQSDLDLRANLIAVPTLDNIVTQTAVGDLKDSGIQVSVIGTKMDKVVTPTLDNIVSMDSSGNSLDSGMKVTEFALTNGNVLNTFSVANSIVDTDAVNQGQMNAISNDYTLVTTFDVHEAAVNPHNTTYTDVGAAQAIHIHAISDVTSLQDSLDLKYTKTTSPITFNIPSYDAANELIDSGMTATSTLLTGEPL